MHQLELSHFVISGSISDFSFESVPVKESIQVEVWRSRQFFEEFFTRFTISPGNSYKHKFSLLFDENEEYQLYLKVKLGDQYLPYSVTISASDIVEEQQFTLEPGVTEMDIKLEMPAAWVAGEESIVFDMTGQLINTSSLKPYANQNVRVLYTEDTVEIADFGTATTNGNGYFPFVLSKNRAILAASGAKALKCEILDEEGEVLASTSISITGDNENAKVWVFETSLSIEVPENSSTISALTSLLSFEIETEISSFLSTNSITTLKGIRRSGGLKYQEDLEESEHVATINLLDAHAQLELVSDDYELNHFLIDDKGYTTLYKIAEKDRAEFIKDTEEYGSTAYLKLAKIHTAAKAGERVMRSLHTGMVLKSTATVNGEGIATINPAFQAYHLPKCGCDDCKAAVSPLAYLSDLIEYAVEHVAWTGTYTDKETKREELQELFCLKFLQIKNKCSEINNTVCQYRVAIEVLSCYMGHDDVEPTACQTAAFASDEKLYLDTAYFVLLEQLGTSFSELRDTIKDTTERQQQLADRLGIVLASTPTTTLDKLFLDPRAISGTRQITNGRLQDIFGLKDYTQNATYSQPTPLIAAWKQAYLESLWLEQAHPDYLFDSLNLPIIDPDLIGPDDFRNPVAGDAAFDLWIKRREFLDNTVLNDKLKDEGVTLTPKGIDLGNRTFTVSGAAACDLVPLMSKIEVVGTNTSINGFYTVIGTTSSTLKVLEPIVDDDYTGVEIRCKHIVAIDSIDVGANSITLNRGLSFTTGNKITITMSDSNDYDFVVESSDNPAFSTTIVVFNSSKALSASTQLGIAVFYRTLNVSDIDNNGIKLRVAGDIDSLPGTFSSVEISGSTGNDGTYTVSSPSYNSTTGLTTLNVDAATPLISTEEDGKVGITVTGIDIKAINAGARTFIVGGSNLDLIIASGSSIAIEAGAGSNDGNYTVTSVTFNGSKNRIAVEEAIDSDIATGNVAYLFTLEDVSGTNSNTLKIADKDLTGLYSEDDSITIIKDNDGSIEKYIIASIDFDDTSADDTVIVLEATSSTGLVDDDKIKFTVPIESIDVSGRYVQVEGNLIGHLFIGNKFTISDSSITQNNREYTVTDIAPSTFEGAGPVTIVTTTLSVAEAVEEDDNTSSGNVFFTKVSQIHKQQPLVSGLFAAMDDTVAYPGASGIAPWTLTDIAIANLSTIKNALLSGSNADYWEPKVASEMHLTRDAFIRMVEIYEKDKQHTLYPSAEAVTDEEWTEFYNILLSSVKAAFNTVWVGEETAIAFDQTNFWFSLQEPIVGNWPRAYDNSLPIIDPQLIDVNQLPGRTAAQHAIDIWNQRNDYLAYLKDELKTHYQTNGIDAVLKQALGTPFAGDNVPFTFSALATDMVSLNPVVANAALAKVEKVLDISVDEFNQIVQFRSKYYTGTSIAADEMDRLMTLLVVIAKRRYLYPIWIAQESVDSLANLTEWGGNSLGFRNTTNTDYDKYWLAIKAKLPKWRTKPADRSAWQQKLQAVHRLPIIDPDIVQLGELVDSDAYDIWQTRKGELDTQLNILRNESIAGGDVAKLETLIENSLEIDFEDFELLDVLESSGVIISGHLKQLGLDYSGYRRLLALYNSAVGGTLNDLLATEWEEVYAILLQAWKWRTKYAAWNAEEKTEDISLSPNFFKLLPDYYPVNLLGDLEVVPLWRISFASRRAWTRTLKGAIAQQDTMLETVKAIVSETEDKVLPIIRDALVKALGEEHAPLEESAQKLTDRLLTDFKVNCCQSTTRVAHSIDVLQRLLWTLHTGVNPELDIPGMVLNAENFDEEWQWLGTYANWRSAMFVFMYPENLLAPELRRDATPKFREIVNAISQASRFTPQDACYYANEYAEYFEDVAKMNVDCSINLRLIRKNPDPCAWSNIYSSKDTLLAFGRGRKTQQVYWVNYHKDDKLGELSGWIPLPLFGDIVKKVLGAVPYTYEYENFIVVMAIAKAKGEPEKLVLAKYDLQKHAWDDTLTEFEIPDDVDTSTILIRQERAETTTVGLVYKSKRGGVYYHRLEKQLTDFDFERSQHIVTHAIGKKFNLVAFAKNGSNIYLILKHTEDKQLYYRILGPRDDWEQKMVKVYTIAQPEATFKGWLFGNDGRMVMLVSLGGAVVHISLKVDNVPFKFHNFRVANSDKTIDEASLISFNVYTQRVFGIGFSDVPAVNSSTFSNKTLKEALIKTIETPSVATSSELGEKFPEWLEAKFKSDQSAKEDWILLDWVMANSLVDVQTIRNGSAGINAPFFTQHGWWGYDTIVRLFASTNNPTTSNAYLPIKYRDTTDAVITFLPLFETGPMYHYWKQIDYLLPNSGISASNNHYLLKYRAIPNFYISPLILNGYNQVELKSGSLDKILRPFSDMFKAPHGSPVLGMQLIRSVLNTELPKTQVQVLGRYLAQYYEEAFYFLPLFLARNLIKNGHYEEAMEWLATLYDFRQEDETKRVIYESLKLDDAPAIDELTRNFDDWLLDPLDPHKLGRTRKNAYLKFTVRTIVECLLQYADANFTIDTVESNSKAAELYEQAIKLLNSDIFSFGSITGACMAFSDETIEEIACILPATNKTDVEQLRPTIKDLVDRLGSTVLAETALSSLKDDLTLNVGEETFDFFGNVATAITNLKATVDGQPEAPTLADINAQKDLTKETYTWSSSSTANSDTVVERAAKQAQQSLVAALMQISGKTEAELVVEPEQLDWLSKSLKEEQEENPEPVYKEGSPLAPAGSDQALMFYKTWPNISQHQMDEYAIPYIPILNQDFCVPANPVYNSLQLWAELNLFKLRNCMNIAGMKRQVDIYAAPTDTTSGIPYIGAGGQIVLPGSIRVLPTQYRYQYIIQRAKELVGIAQQLEANLLSLLEKKDSESYSLMKAKQDMALARANVKLQDLRIKVSEGEVDMAVLQKERSELQVEGLEGLIAEGLLSLEEEMLNVYEDIAKIQKVIAISNAISRSSEAWINAWVLNGPNDIFFSGLRAGLAAVVTASSAVSAGAEVSLANRQSWINQMSINASQARREQEWNFQKSLAEKDVNIGQQGIRVAKDRLRVTGQERQISNLQLGHAEDTVNFLNNKFTNVELYSWMSGVIEGVYAYFLRQATATAKMAQNQLAFERQELPTPFIQDDYWESPGNSTGLAIGDGSSTVDRRGMTGSTRLLQDIYKVDQFAFETDRRKLQLAKTFSLSRMAAIEFQRFRETGEITFETLMEHFDRDFPGHYLRLIKKVNVSIIALVPPVDGVKAMLTSSGISHVVTKGDTFQDTVVRREPEMIAFTGAQNATGLFELQPDERFANPFEGSGVHMRWQLQLPTDTNLFNFDTIADVLVTIEYTALHSYDYQQQVLRKLDPEYSAERAFSFREELPDQFYELNNPDQSDTPMEVSFDVSAFDFPAGVKDVYIKSVKAYYVVDDDQRNFFEQQYAGLKTQLQLVTPSLNTGFADATPSKSGLISTESGNGGGYLTFIGKQPYGKWTYKLPDDNLVKKLFADEVIRDVIFIIGFGGTVKPRVNP